MPADEVIDQQPTEALLLGIVGDPFDFRLRLLDGEGQPVDVTGWEWRATVSTGRERFEFEYAADAAGVTLWLRGTETARVPPLKPWPYDVTCRQPEASEGRTVLRGTMTLAARVTVPLRDQPDVVPADPEPYLVPA